MRRPGVKKLPYFDSEWSLASCTDSIKEPLSVIASRYLGANPPSTFHVRAVSTDQFTQAPDGSWILDLVPKLGNGSDGYAVISGMLMSEIEKTVTITVSCFSPVQLYLNGDNIFSSTFTDEINQNLGHSFDVMLRPGRNVITVGCRRTAAGFGCRLSLPQTPILSPLPEQMGQAGWVWSDVVEKLPKEEPLSPDASLWNPRGDRTAGGASAPQERIFPEGGGYCVAWCKLDSDEQAGEHSLVIESFGPNEVYLDGQLLLRCEAGKYKVPVGAARRADLWIKSRCDGVSYGAVVKTDGCKLCSPGTVNGSDEIWVYTGCFDEEDDVGLEELLDIFSMPGGKRWYLDREKLCLRTFFEGSFSDKYWVSQGGSAFGRWDYPLGVTLFGLLKTSLTLGRTEMTTYVNQHIKRCISLYAAAVSDKFLNGSPSFDQNLVRMDCLDDCGSMGLAMLECQKLQPDESYMETARRIRDFIVCRLPKLEDGTFYRPASKPSGTATIWADDLYMSTPFLRCFYDVTGDKEALNLAASQFLLFADYLLIPGVNIFSHVYDLTRGCATGIPWGRGNGWVLFSLAYFLDGLTAKAEREEELKALFLKLSKAYLGLQGEHGLWHQVLTDSDSYEEASCTAMFTFAFCKGVRNGWYGEDTLLYMNAARTAFRGLTEHCIDRNGSVHAVCKGSGFSFTKEYYSEELFWVTNDNHGIGIVLLAGNELLSAEEYLVK